MYHCIPALLLVFFLVSPAKAWEHFVFSTADGQESSSAKMTNLVLIECFHRLQYKLTILPRPSKRSIYEANQGRVDGDFARTAAVAKAYPNLIKVPEHIAQESLTAFSSHPNLKVDGWGSLLSRHVAWVNGRIICDSHLGHSRQKTLESNETALLRFLSEGRAEVGVMGLKKGLELLRQLNITNVHPLLPPLEVVRLYLYVHKRHKALVPKVAAMLRAMKEDGTVEAIRQYFYEGTPYPRERLTTALN